MNGDVSVERGFILPDGWMATGLLEPRALVLIEATAVIAR